MMRAFAFAALAATLVGCASVAAQDPDGGRAPRAEADAGRRRRALADDAGPRRRRRVALDAGAPDDAGAPLDAAFDLDAALDAGLEAGPVLDASSEADAALDAEIEDGGIVGLDAWQEPDAWVEPDAAAPADDAAVTSALVPVDAAVVPAAPATTPPLFDPWVFFGRERPSEPEPSSSSASPAPVVTVLPQGDEALWRHIESLVPALPQGRSSGLFLLALLFAAWVASRWLTRARSGLPERGLLPRTLTLLHVVVRLLMTLLVLGLLTLLLPDWAMPALPWVVVAVAVALGWSARDLLPDLVAGAVLFAERRVVVGEHLVVGDHAGVVVEAGVRVVTLRDASGRRIDVPNRVVLTTPVETAPGAWHESRLVVRAPEGASADAFTRALREAVLFSPWVPVPCDVEVARDTAEPSLFHVRASLVHARHEERFRGELLRRAEAILARAKDAKESSPATERQA